MSGRAWTHKVVRRARGAQGEWFDYPAAAAFTSLEAAQAYAERWSRELTAQRSGHTIDVRARGGRRNLGVTVSTVRWHAP